MCCTQRPRSTRSFVSDVNSPFQCLFRFLLFLYCSSTRRREKGQNGNEEKETLNRGEMSCSDIGVSQQHPPPCRPVDPTLPYVASAGIIFLLSFSFSLQSTVSSLSSSSFSSHIVIPAIPSRGILSSTRLSKYRPCTELLITL